MKVGWKHLYFCEGCAKGFCLLGGQGVRYGPVGRAWGFERYDPIVNWFRNTDSEVGHVDCTGANMGDF